MDRNTELVKNTAIIGISKIGTRFISFLLIPVYTAILSPENYGIVDLVTTYVSLLMPLVLLQVDQALFRFLADARSDEGNQTKIISTTVLFALIQMIIVISIFGIMQLFIKSEFKWILFLNLFALICLSLMLQTVRGLGDNILYAKGSFLSAVLQISGNIVFLVFFKIGVYGMLFSPVIAYLLTSTYIFLKKHLRTNISARSFDFNELKRMLRYSVPLIPNALSWWLLTVSDRLIVQYFLGVSFNGLLSVGYKFSTAYIAVYEIFNLSWVESAVLHIDNSDREEFFSGVIVNMFKVFICMGMGVVACVPLIFPILVDDNYLGAYHIIPMLMLGSMFSVVNGLYSAIYVAMKKTKEIAKTSVGAGIINIIVHLVLVKFIGLYATAISTVIAFGVLVFYRYFKLKRYINVKLPGKWIVFMVGVYIVVNMSFYSNFKIFQIIVLLFVVVISVIANKKLLLAGKIYVAKIVNKLKK